MMAPMENQGLERAALDGMPLLDESCNTGGAFVLDEEAPADRTARAEDGWAVEVRSGSRVVVARGSGANSPKEAHALGIDAAQHGLDRLSIRNLGDHRIRRADDENLVWWPDGDQRVLRACSVASLRIDVPAVTVRITDASGKEKPQPAEVEPVWHPSFRFFRLAQVSEEVFDAYRNLYLALESILSAASPPKSGEREKDWISRALNEAEAKGMNLAAFAPPDAVDPADSIRQELYSDTRTATFHAKVGARTLLPLDAVDRRAVLASLSRLAGLYLALVEKTLGVRRPSGGMFRAGFDMLIGNIVEELQIHVTDDPTPMQETDTVINPGGGVVKALATRAAPELDQAFLRNCIGEAPVEELRELTHVARVAATTADGSLMSGGQLEGRLTLGGFDRFEVAMGIRGVNVRPPRSFYPL
jgi:hypothetical protein